MKERRKRKRRKAIYSRGELNRMVDSALHPLFETSPVFMAVDEVAHLLIEQDLRESIVKFIRYSLPALVQKILEDIDE